MSPLEAHLRLLAILPVRTHVRKDPDAVNADEDLPPSYVEHHARNAEASARRRRQIAALLAEGLDRRSIARRMRITVRCVQTHLKALREAKAK